MRTLYNSAGKLKGEESRSLRKRIGSTTYEVVVRFSDRTSETMEDKILRLIESEVRKSA